MTCGMEDLTSVLHVFSFAMKSGSATKNPLQQECRGYRGKIIKDLKKSLQENPGMGLM